MTDPIDRKGLRDRYWETVPLNKMNPKEWEALCDGCGKCCLLKLEDDETQEIAFTRVSCRLLDTQACKCGQYEIRKTFVPDCVVLTPDTLKDIAYWMPQTCAYRLLHEGKQLHYWHPLVSGDPDSVHKAGASVQGWAIPEFEVDEEDLEEYLLEDD
ncbi:MAG: putative cysteine cluster protein YcgN (CxxCxxCC family) [Dinoroseobacter sp.]|jgi:uncharacterized cysteine cluster protein YcgN (CxxCxxCC family)